MATHIGYNISFPIYNEDGSSFYGIKIENATVDSVVMSLGDKITGDFYYKDNQLRVTMKEYIVYDDVRYMLVNPPTVVREGLVSDNNELKGMTKYSVEFYHPMCQLANFPFSDIAVNSDEERYLSQNKSFSWIGKPSDFIAKLNKNLEQTVWIVRKSERFPQEKDDVLSEVLTFDNNTVADALKTCYETWEEPYTISQLPTDDEDYGQGKRFLIEYGLPSNEIYVDNTNTTPFIFQFGKGVGLKNNSRTPRNNKIVTRISGFGSETNIPYGYPQIRWYGNQDWEYTLNNQSGVQDVTLPDGRTVQAQSFPIYEGIVGGKWVKLIKHPFTRTHLMPSIYAQTIFNKVSQYRDWNNGSTIPTYTQTLAELKHTIDVRIQQASVQGVKNAYQALLDNLDLAAAQSGAYTKNFSGQTPIAYEGLVRITNNGLIDGYLYIPSEELEFEFEEVLNESAYEFMNQDFDPTAEIIDYYDAISEGDYTYPNEINPNAPSYEIHEFEDIKPELGSAEIVDATPLDESLQPIDSWDYTMDEEGNINPSYFRLTLPILSFDLYACAAITQEMQINMRGGACVGCTFPIQVDWDDYKSNFYDVYGNFLPDGDQRDLTKYPKSNETSIDVIVQKENSTFGTLMPNMYQYPKPDDSFVILGISLPLSYITNAEERLDNEMKSYMLENNIYYYDYPLKFDEHFFAKNPNILSQIAPNTIIRFVYGNENLELFVKQLTIKYANTPLPQYDITLTDDIEVSLNQIGQVAEDVEKLGTLISIMRQSYSRNMWNELAKKLSKTSPDVANALIRFAEGLSVGNGTYGIDGNGNANLLSMILQSLTGESYTGSDIVGDKGFRLWQDEEGYGHLDIDYLTARMKAYFAELEIRKVTFTQGDLFFSKAGSRIVRVVPVDIDGNVLTPTEGTLHLFSSNGLYFSANGGWYSLGTTDEYTDSELLEQIYAYRCYELSDDGTTATMNLWEVGDMARCQTFNIDAGVHQGVTNRYYSRLVVRKGKEAMADVDDGLQYNYVDLYVGNATMADRSVVSALYDDEGNALSKDNSGYVNNGSHYFVGYDPNVPEGFNANDLPAVGDDIAQVGSQTYKDRQNLIQLALSDGGAIKIYSGVNTYNLADFEKVRIGPNGVVVDAAYFRLRSTTGEGGEQGVPMWRGEWSSLASYAKWDYVEHNGSLWIWMEDTIAQGVYCEPGDNGGWQVYVSRGEAGEVPKITTIMLDTSNISVIYEADGSVTMDNITGLPTTMYVDYGGERVPTSAMSEVVVGYRIKGTGQQWVGRGIYPKNYTINEDDFSLAWDLGVGTIQSQLLFSVTFEVDGEEHTATLYLPVLKTTKAQDGADGANAVDVVLSPTALTIEETGADPSTYDTANASAQVRILDGENEIIPDSVSFDYSPANALDATYSNGTIALSNITDNIKSVVVSVSVQVNGNTYTRYLHVYINRMGSWKLDVEGDVASSLSEQQVWVDGQLQTMSTEIRQSAVQLGLIGDDIVFKANDGTVFMQMIAHTIDGETVYKVSTDNLDVSNLEARNINITGQSVFRGFLMREKYTIQASDFVYDDVVGNYYLEYPLDHYGSWVEFAADIDYPVNYYEIELPHFPLTASDTYIAIGDEVIDVNDITDSDWERYCAYVMQFVGAKMLVENNKATNELTLDLFTLFQHYGDSSQSQSSFAIRETLRGLTSLECKCAYINNAYYRGMAVYWEVSTGGIPEKTEIINL